MIEKKKVDIIKKTIYNKKDMKDFYKIKREFPKKKVDFSQVQSVKDCLGELDHDFEMFCLSVGQFNLIDIIEYILETTGPADVTLATWTAAGSNIDKAFKFLESGKIRKMRVIVDPSFKARQPEYCANLMQYFPNSVRTIPTHAKFTLIQNENWNFVLQTSMNLNQNKRLENFNLSENFEFAEFFRKFSDDVFEKFEIDDLFGSQNPNVLNKVVKLDEKKKFVNSDPNFCF